MTVKYSTDQLVECVRIGTINGDQPTINAAIKEIAASLTDGETALVDAEPLAKAVLYKRAWTKKGILDTKQVNDYVRHCLREAPYCCRHAIDGSVYKVHAEETCSDRCSEKYAQGKKTDSKPRYGICENCNIALPASGKCDWCD